RAGAPVGRTVADYSSIRKMFWSKVTNFRFVKDKASGDGGADTEPFVLVLARGEYGGQVLGRAQTVLMRHVQGGEAKPNDVRLPVVPDHAARDQRLHHAVRRGV